MSVQCTYKTADKTPAKASWPKSLQKPIPLTVRPTDVTSRQSKRWCVGPSSDLNNLLFIKTSPSSQQLNLDFKI